MAKAKKPYVNLTGQRYGKLTVVSLVNDVAGGKVPTRWLCKCDCGNEVVARGYNLRGGNTKSCGCAQREVAASRQRTHGDTGSRLYVIWRHMMERCEKAADPAYKHYGGRGVSICKEWHDYETFRSWAISSGYDETLTLDRIDVNGNYEPNNCRWATHREQQLNRRNNVRVSFGGETKTLSEWAEIFGCHPQSVCREILEREGRIIRCDGGVDDEIE